MLWKDWVNFTMEDVWKRETETKVHIISRLVLNNLLLNNWPNLRNLPVSKSKITPPKYQQQLRHTILSRIFIT